MWSNVNIKILITATFTLRCREEQRFVKVSFYSAFSNIWEQWWFMPGEKKKALRVEYIKQDRKRNNFQPPPASTFSPSFSSHWMPPHWSPPRPWMPAGVPLTFNLWPPAPLNSSQSRQLSALSGEHILWSTVIATEGSDSGEYRC